MIASVVITTKNRPDDLRRAIASALEQDCPVEVIVVDDASTDDTREVVRAEFPTVRLITHQESTGYIRSRNEGVAAASAPIVVLIDDDSELAARSTIRDTVLDFDHPAVGAVAIPFVNVTRSQRVHKAAPDKESIWVTTSFIGCAHAVRRDLFLELGGYRESFVHYGEEGDFCRRLMRAGYVTRLGRAEPVLHHLSAEGRVTDRESYYGARAAMLLAWHTLPLPVVPLHLIVEAVRKLSVSSRGGGISPTMRGLVAGLRDGAGDFRGRTPLRWPEYGALLGIRFLGPRKAGFAVKQAADDKTKS